jgi:hypothetical protein
MRKQPFQTEDKKVRPFEDIRKTMLTNCGRLVGQIKASNEQWNNEEVLLVLKLLRRDAMTSE